MEEVVPQLASRRSSDADIQGGDESDPAEGVRRRCMKNYPSFLSCIGKRTKQGCDRGSEVVKSRQFTADKTGKSQFLRGNRRNLAGEGVVRKSQSLVQLA